MRTIEPDGLIDSQKMHYSQAIVDFEDVRKVTVYLVDAPENREVYQDVYEEVFDADPYPCHTILGVDVLALEEFLLEIEVEL